MDMENPPAEISGPDGNRPGVTRPQKSLVIVYSCHHKNTEKIANVIGNILGAPVKTPREITPDDLYEYDLVGFGSGIYGAHHHASLIGLAGRLSDAGGRKAFIFSTFGAPEGLYFGERLTEFIRNNHSQLRGTLEASGYTVADEFSCPGFNTNSFLSLFGGLNKGRPDALDLKHAEEFAGNLKRFSGF